MKFPNEVKKCVVFIAIKMANEQKDEYKYVGTGFFIQKIINEGPISFLVTAKHVILGIKSTGVEFIYIRVNTIDNGSRWYTTQIDDWIFHDDETIDIAVVNLIWEADWDHLLYLDTAMVTNKHIEDNEIDVGDEVFIVGLFIHHQGTNRNIPIARIGNIAAMPEEKIQAELHLIDAYLIEARSIGGLSGSPVFINLRAPRVTNGLLTNNNTGFGHLLMGIVHGHFDEVQFPKETIETDNAKKEMNRINMGIAIIVPAEKIIEVINAVVKLYYKKNKLFSILLL